MVNKSQGRLVFGWVLSFGMELQLVASVEFLEAELTFEQLDVEVASLVVPHVPVRDEPLATDFAGKWLLFRVGPDVVH